MEMLNKRVRELEKRQVVKDEVLAVWYEDEPVLTVCESEERLTPAEFMARYPDGIILHVVYKAAPVLTQFALR
jgi:hypothetical protein